MSGIRLFLPVALLGLGLLVVWLAAGATPDSHPSRSPRTERTNDGRRAVTPSRLSGTAEEDAAERRGDGDVVTSEDGGEGPDPAYPLVLRVRMRGTETLVSRASLVLEDDGHSLAVTNRSGELVLEPAKRSRLRAAHAKVVAAGFHAEPLPDLPDRLEFYEVGLTPRGASVILTGRVSSKDGTPVVGAYVELGSEFMTRSKAGGSFEATLPSWTAEDRELEIRAWAPGFDVTEATVNGIEPPPWRGFVDLVLEPVDGWAPLILRVMTESGRPARGAAYRLSSVDRAWRGTRVKSRILGFIREYAPQSGTVPRSGRVEFPSLPVVPTRFRVLLPGTYAEPVVTPRTDASEIDVTMLPGRRALVTFDIEAGEESRRSHVRCVPTLKFDDGAYFRLDSIRAVDGLTQEITGLPWSEFALQLSFGDRPCVRVHVEASQGPSDDTIAIPCVLEEGREITGTIRYKDGRLVPHGHISVETVEGKKYSAWTRTGEFVLAHFVGHPRSVQVTVWENLSESSRSTFITQESHNWDADIWLLTVERRVSR